MKKAKNEIIDARPKKRTKSLPAGCASAEVGRRDRKVGYAKNGDKITWVPDCDRPGKQRRIIVLRNENAIRKAEAEFTDLVWYERKLVLLHKEKERAQQLDPGIRKQMLAAMRRVENRYGKRKLLRGYDDMSWGELNGKMVALRWVLGGDWGDFDT